MSARILDGKSLAAELRAEIAGEVAAFRITYGRAPGLGVILVGDDPASRSYVTGKEKACAAAGIHSREITLPATAHKADILAAVTELNLADSMDGVLVQLPLPDATMETEVLAAVDPAKDVDGFHALNVGHMVQGQPALAPCTPSGVIELLRRAHIPLSGANVVLIGRSQIVGRPLSILLSQKGTDATVTLCHTRTRNLAQHTREADIVIVAAGRPKTLTADMVSPGVVVIDVGVNRVPATDRPRGYRLVGDVDFDAVATVAAAITPVPGGVGPLTVAMLLRNTLTAANRRVATPS